MTVDDVLIPLCTHSGNSNAIDIFCLRTVFVQNSAFVAADKAQSDRPLFSSNLTARNPFGSGQVDNNYSIRSDNQTFPVGSDRKGIHILTPDIIDLLPFVFFHDDLICQTCTLDPVDTLR